jgi:hypothetical protein
VKRGIGIHGIRQRTENYALGPEEARLMSRLNNHGWWVPGSGELHGSGAAINSGRRQCEEKSWRANILNHQRVQSAKYIRERRAIT